MKRINIPVIFLLFASVCFSQKINIKETRNMTYGTVFPGINKTITETSPSAGKFVIESVPPVEILITFTLPPALTSGSNFIPVTYTGTISTNRDDNIPGTQFDPYTGVEFIFDPHRKVCYVRLGGTVYPAPIQPAGNYSATLVIIITRISD